MDGKQNGAMPAHPVPNSANVNGQVGMTKRELLAAMAMQGFLSHGVNSMLLQANTHHSLTWSVARASIAYADALLAELAKEPT